MLASLLILGLWPTVLVVVVSILIVIGIETDGAFYANTAFVIGTLALIRLHRLAALPWIQTHAGLLLGCAIGYFVIGVVWAFFKWYLFCIDRLEVQRESRVKPTAPAASDHKARITGWMTYWPWSAAWWLMHEPVTRVWRVVYAKTAAQFQRISDSVFRDA
jgi:hypothetical protein